MRYSPQRRRQFPDAEDIKAFSALDDACERQDVTYKKIPYLPPPDVKSKREHWYPLAQVIINDQTSFIVEYKEYRKLGQDIRHKVNKQSIVRIEHRRKVWTERMGYDILYLNRDWSSQIMRWAVENKIKELKIRKEE